MSDPIYNLMAPTMVPGGIMFPTRVTASPARMAATVTETDITTGIQGTALIATGAVGAAKNKEQYPEDLVEIQRRLKNQATVGEGVATVGSTMFTVGFTFLPWGLILSGAGAIAMGVGAFVSTKAKKTDPYQQLTRNAMINSGRSEQFAEAAVKYLQMTPEQLQAERQKLQGRNTGKAREEEKALLAVQAADTQRWASTVLADAAGRAEEAKQRQIDAAATRSRLTLMILLALLGVMIVLIYKRNVANAGVNNA